MFVWFTTSARLLVLVPISGCFTELVFDQFALIVKAYGQTKLEENAENRVYLRASQPVFDKFNIVLSVDGYQYHDV